MDTEEDKKETNIEETKVDEEGVEHWKTKAREYLDGWKRAQADFINFKKDEVKRLQEFLRFANEGLVIEVIDALDNLDNAIFHMPGAVLKDTPQWAEGVKKTQEIFRELLKKYGVDKIKTDGEKFNPLYHEAVADESNGDKEDEHIISEELRAGYTLNGKVIRPARVKVK